MLPESTQYSVSTWQLMLPHGNVPLPHPPPDELEDEEELVPPDDELELDELVPPEELDEELAPPEDEPPLEEPPDDDDEAPDDDEHAEATATAAKSGQMNAMRIGQV